MHNVRLGAATPPPRQPWTPLTPPPCPSIRSRPYSPLLPDDELAELADDIAANGLIHPIVLDHEGRVVDGRNRLAACRLADVEPRFEYLNGNDPAAFIASSNINRRHLTVGQRAMALAMIYPDPEKGGRGKKGQSETDGFSIDRLTRAREAVIKKTFYKMKSFPPPVSSLARTVLRVARTSTVRMRVVTLSLSMMSGVTTAPIPSIGSSASAQNYAPELFQGVFSAARERAAEAQALALKAKNGELPELGDPKGGRPVNRDEIKHHSTHGSTSASERVARLQRDHPEIVAPGKVKLAEINDPPLAEGGRPENLYEKNSTSLAPGNAATLEADPSARAAARTR